MRDRIKNKTFAYIISIFCMFLWGSAFPVIKMTYNQLQIGPKDYFSMIFVAGLRFTLAGILVFIIMLFFDKKNIKQIKQNFPYMLKLGLLSITFGYLFFYIGTGNTSGMKSALLTSSSTFLLVIFSHFMLDDERFNKFKLIAIILGLLGVIFSNINKSFDFTFSIMGEGFMLINAILGALSTIFVKKYGKNISPFASASGQNIFGGVLLAIVGFIGLESQLNFDLVSLALIAYGGILSALAFSLWYFVLSEYKASEISFLRLFIPFFGTFLSAIILGEILNIGIILGLICVILGILVVNKSYRYNKEEEYVNR